MTARMAMASGPEMSTRAASAAQASRKEAATTAAPNVTRLSGAATCTPLRRRNKAGMVSTRHSASGRASLADMTTLRDGRAARTGRPGVPRPDSSAGRRSRPPNTEPSALGPATGGRRSPQHVDDRSRDYSPSDTASLANILLITQMTRHIVRRITRPGDADLDHAERARTGQHGTG